MTLTFALRTSWSMDAVRLPCTECILSLVLIVQTGFLLDRIQTDRHTHKVTDATDLVTMHYLLPAWVITAETRAVRTVSQF